MPAGSSKDTACRRCKKTFDVCKCDQHLNAQSSRKRSNLEFSNPGKAWVPVHPKRQSTQTNLFIKSNAMPNPRSSSSGSHSKMMTGGKQMLSVESSSHESDMLDDDNNSESGISSDGIQLDEGDRFEYFQAGNPYVGLERASDGSLYYDEDNQEIQNVADAAFVVADRDTKQTSELDVEGWKSVAHQRKYSDPACKEYGKSERQVQCQHFYKPHCPKTGSVDRQDVEAQFEGFRPGSCIQLSVGSMNLHVVLVSCVENPDSSIRIGFTLDFPERQRKDIQRVLITEHNAHVNGERLEMTLNESMHVTEVMSDSDASCSEDSWFFDSNSAEEIADMDVYDTEQESAKETDQSESSSDDNAQDEMEPGGPKL